MIDKKLAKEIGATHFILNDDHSVGLYRISSAHVMLWNESEFWEVYLGDNFYQAERIDFTEPEMVVEYMKVTDSIFDLRESLEAGELYHEYDGSYMLIDLPSVLCAKWCADVVYRKVEKPVDWKGVAREFGFCCESNFVGLTPISEGDFIKFIKRIYPLVK